MFLGTIVLVWATLIIFPAILMLQVVSSGNAGFHLSILWARVVSWGFGISFSLHGKEKIVPGISYILVCNHGSIMDPLVLGPSLFEGSLYFRWVMKRELLQIPLFGWGLKALGAVELDRSKSNSGLTLLQRARNRLKDGWSLVIFPEGTRTRDGELLPFKRGTFVLAIQTGIPILPITTNGTFRILRRGTTLIRPGHVTVTVGDPIFTRGLTRKDIPTLMERTHGSVQQHFDPAYDPFQMRG
jgi:1-acyl-sn-glycerol-3-phosphate acyltransferase